MTDLAAARADTFVVDGRYRLLEPVGTSPSGSVWSTVDLRLHRTVAVRVFTSAIPAERAAATLGAVESAWAPGMSRLLDAGTESGIDGEPYTFLVRELVTGTSWTDWVGRGGVPVATLAVVAADVAGTLAHLHRHGVAHGSVTGSNVFVPDRPADAASSFDTDRTTVLTDPGVRQMLGAPAVHPTDDVRRFGETLLGSLTGRDVLGSRTLHAALAHLRRDAGLRSRERAKWTELLLAMTSEDTAARPSAATVASSLTQLGHERAGHRAATTPRRQPEPPWEVIFTV